jgi:hypothetical protein
LLCCLFFCFQNKNTAQSNNKTQVCASGGQLPNFKEVPLIVGGCLVLIRGAHRIQRISFSGFLVVLI